MADLKDIEFKHGDIEDLWKSLPVKSHTGNLANASRTSARRLLHATVEYYRPEIYVEFGFNVGHSALIAFDAVDKKLHFHSYDILETGQKHFQKTFKNFRFVIDDSVEGFKKHPVNDIDFIFIDSLHTYDHVKNEINTVFENIKPGGILFFDDMDKDEIRDAVRDSNYSKQMKEVTNWVDDYHCVTPYIDLKGGWRWKTINRIFKKLK